MKLITLVLLTIFSVLGSCNRNESSYRLIEEISITSLRNSNQALSQLSAANYNSLTERLRDDIYGENVELWNSKALKLKSLTSEIINQINNNFPLDTLMPLKQKYIREVISLDSNLKKVFEQNIDSFLINYSSTISPLFNIEKTKNDLLILESLLSGYFNNKLGAIIEDYTVFSALVGQNSNHLESGETLEVSAGIGSYSMAAKPMFIINSDTINAEEGRASYKLKVMGKGKKNIPVKIIYTSSKGKQELKNFSLDYYVDE